MIDDHDLLDDPMSEMEEEEDLDLTAEETIDELERRGLNPMDTETDQQLQFGHSILHSWVEGEPDEPAIDEDATDWPGELIEEEHERLAAEMDRRGIDHDTPLGNL